MTTNYLSGSSELLRVAKFLSTSKEIPYDTILDTIKDAISIASRKQYGYEYNIITDLNRETGEVNIFAKLDVVEEPTNKLEVSLKEAKKYDKNAELDKSVYKKLPNLGKQRVVVQVVRHILTQGVKNAIKEKQYEEFKHRLHEVVYGIVKKVSEKYVLVDINGIEACLSRKEMIPDEFLQPNDRIKAYVRKIVRSNDSPQVFLSRVHNEFLIKLFIEEVPEIYSGTIEIKSVVRDPGSKAKMAVYTSDNSIDAVGACIGVRGNRVQEISKELQGEKIDIIEWSEDPVQLTINSLAPTRISKVVVDEKKHIIEVVVPDNQLRIAIGRKGQNIKLTSWLVGWRVEVMDVDDAEKVRKDESEKIFNHFMKVLDIDEIQARILVSEGLTEVVQITYLTVKELSDVDGISSELATNLHKKAELHVKQLGDKKEEEKNGKDENEKNEEEFIKNTKKKEDKEIPIIEVPNINEELEISLRRHGIVFANQIADLSREELIDILPNYKLTHKEMNEIIMSARKLCFTEENTDKSAE